MSQTKVKTKEEIAEAYDSPSWWYDARGFFILTFAYRSTLWEQIFFFGENIKERHLEVAIGSATLFSFIRYWRRWKKLPDSYVSGIDYAPAMLAGALHKYQNDPTMDLQLADVANLPYDDEIFDSVNIANAIHCFPDVDGAIKDVVRVMKPGAELATNVLLYPRGPRPLKWLAQKIDDWGIRKGILVTPYELEDIKGRLEHSGLEVTYQRVRGNTYNVRARKPGSRA